MTTAPRKVKNEVDYPVWLSTDEAARYLGFSARTLALLVVEGKVPAYRFGRVFRYRLDQIQASIEGARVAPEQEETA